MFAMVSTRPDIAQVVRAASEYMANLGCDHWTAIKWILRYLRGTSHFGLFDNYTNLSCVQIQILLEILIKEDLLQVVLEKQYSL